MLKLDVVDCLNEARNFLGGTRNTGGLEWWLLFHACDLVVRLLDLTVAGTGHISSTGSVVQMFAIVSGV